jgi:hypothetical protein
MVMAVWMNPTEDPLKAWTSGIELVEIFSNKLTAPEPELTQHRIQPRWGVPGIILTLTSPEELNLDEAMNKKGSFYRQLRRRLENGSAEIVLPHSSRPAAEVLDEIMGPVDVEL